MRAHILIVEDEALLYKRLKKVLGKERYTIDDFTPSVEKALERIQKKRPDIVLLDIDLQGKLSGLDLGKMLYETYGILFIYLTGFDDDRTFYEGLNTHHEHFIVKSKPRLNEKEIIRSIHTTLQKRNSETNVFFKNGIMGLIMYLSDMKDTSHKEITKVPVQFSDISFFTVKPFINEDDKQERLKANYLWFQTKDKNYYFLRSSLSDIIGKLPYHFVRINESYIVNISAKHLTGQISESRISVVNQMFTISERYKKEVKNRFKLLYE
ncbi:response regulator transcription factor [Pseudotenacibaculum haliotis]|uniref:Response regulator transcription factor n=1 Tax=Pseudotenacibaculum haliotis TaxID=1862138 RepID=A0ABW5LNP5_9FLAO